MTPEQFRALARPEVRRLARRGKLVDTAFKVFCDAVFPGAENDQRNALRIAFFAGAQELHVMQMTAVDEGTDITDEDVAIYGQISDEIERFYRRTLSMMEADGRPS